MAFFLSVDKKKIFKKKLKMQLFIKNLLSSIKNNFTGLYSNLKDYFDSYGGWIEILKSPYFALSFIANLFLYKSWTTSLWIKDVKEIIPSILGFSLGAYAIIATFGNERFQDLIADEEENKNTLYRKINTTFIHFILTQVLSLLLAVMCTSLLSESYGFWEIIISFIGNLVFVYSIFLSMAAVMTIFRITKIYQAYINTVKK